MGPILERGGSPPGGVGFAGFLDGGGFIPSKSQVNPKCMGKMLDFSPRRRQGVGVVNEVST